MVIDVQPGKPVKIMCKSGQLPYLADENGNRTRGGPETNVIFCGTGKSQVVKRSLYESDGGLRDQLVQHRKDVDVAESEGITLEEAIQRRTESDKPKKKIRPGSTKSKQEA